jgi:hypothetical protein
VVVVDVVRLVAAAVLVLVAIAPPPMLAEVEPAALALPLSLVGFALSGAVTLSAQRHGERPELRWPTVLVGGVATALWGLWVAMLAASLVLGDPPPGGG